MNYTRVTSSAVHKVGYDPETKTLEIHWKGGAPSSHPEISQAQHDELIAAPSVGKHLSKMLRKIAVNAARIYQ